MAEKKASDFIFQKHTICTTNGAHVNVQEKTEARYHLSLPGQVFPHEQVSSNIEKDCAGVMECEQGLINYRGLMGDHSIDLI